MLFKKNLKAWALLISKALLISLFVLLPFGSTLQAKTQVLVSIHPQKFLVDRIGGETVAVEVIVPPGANSHSYEPTPRQMLAVQKGEIWFRVGESFETRMVPLLHQTLIVDQREGLDLLKEGCGCCHAHEAHDPHIWLSPRLLKQQSRQIAHILSEQDPEHKCLYTKNLNDLEEELNRLDQECLLLLKDSPQRYILLSHPAFGYFCRDYELHQLSIEMEGREPTPRALTELISNARAHQIKIVFLQKQHNPKGGQRVAKELGAKTVYLDPYVENVIDNLRTIAKLFSLS